MKQKIILLSLLIFSFSARLVAQTNSGSAQFYLTDQKTGDAVIGANIALYKEEVFIAGSVCDVEGVATINDLAPGSYQIQISIIGYEAYSDSLRIEPNQMHIQNIALTEVAVHLEPVIVTIERIKPRDFGCGGPRSFRPMPVYRSVPPNLIPGMYFSNGRAPAFSNLRSSMQNSSFSGAAW